MSDEKMKILHVYRSEPTDDVKKLVEILSRDRDAKEYSLYMGEPNYDILVQMIKDADKTVSWW
ncbi:MAG: hypothetical protein JRJ43_04425 [Deltaproteobacteria bacterium]|nr:hypothetical protein [Deltaproteobacteria bacterium]MBW1718798.1 hypothetical protein [Deltaproteobacteria bacterium]MBW1931888.1 hypothetical protein [Deltaproteobacteria bacterium]MBW1937542.1 hypothetical protein [Deltaproteobacteria bacterium]MBW1964118.1 hypothetical protein [Deltaproteobacteria bacterium]